MVLESTAFVITAHSEPDLEAETLAKQGFPDAAGLTGAGRQDFFIACC